jgi:hypothetical protein
LAGPDPDRGAVLGIEGILEYFADDIVARIAKPASWIYARSSR